ncbi:MAG: hypothetical protein A4E64_00249 [Syntrophorhabdus sp. PtaU1.Bin058]|nr:MAG: hypothetical protein A4E64_00249 [Syntrophorhabdus sp. PtaU1.Bin058]
MKVFLSAVVVLSMVVSWWWPERAAAAAKDTCDTNPAAIGKALAERFSMDFRTLAYGTIQEPADSTQNPSNSLLAIPRYLADLEMRPDLRLNLDLLDLSVKPRMKLEHRTWQGGVPSGQSAWDDDWYVNEWLARWKAHEELFISYGRENLQWGPSFLFSPSNPFFQDNGRRNPYLEVAGTDFGRLVWVPEGLWTISFIVNTDEGRMKIAGPDPFKKTYALKIDYTDRENYGSVILSHREDSWNSLGYFGGLVVTDAILLYSEGAVTQGSRALYSVKNNSSPFMFSMQQPYGNSNALKPVFLFGGSYTFETKGTFTTEYAYNGIGYSDAEADRYYYLRRKASDAINSGGRLSALSQMTLGQTVNTGLRFLRRNYILLQYNQTNIRNKMDITLRWTQNLDDGSCQFTSIVSYFLNNHLELFSVGVLNGGNRNTEFGSILDYQWMIGLKYTF